MAEKNFPFIVLNGPKLNDPGARKLIRKQAMKDVGNARRKRGNYGKVNLRPSAVVFDEDQRRYRATAFPIRTLDSSDSSDETLDHSPDTAESSASTDPTEPADEELSRELVVSTKAFPVDELHSSTTPLSFAAISLFSNYETARAKFTVDVTDLAILTNFNVGKSSIPILSADPTRLASLLGYPQWSYLQFVPALYGSSPSLTAATNCLLSKVKGILSPYDHCKEVTMRLYAKALRTLQEAIASESGCLDAEILCATQLLSLHELLDPSRDAAWSQHINGSARLVKHRTPARFKSEFEKVLFASHVGPIVSECLVSNQACYLEQPAWMELYLSLARESDYLDDRSPLTIKIRSLMFPISGLWYEIGETMTGPQLFDDDALASLAARCRKLHQSYIDWMEDYKAHCVKLSLTTPPAEEIAMRRELFGASLECLVIVKRLLASVCDEERERLETECQALAHLILDLQKQPSSKHSWLFSGHEVGIAYTVMLTKDQWEGNMMYESDEARRLAARVRYNTWSNTLRMTG